MAGEESAAGSQATALREWIGGEEAPATLVFTDIVRATLLLYGDDSTVYIQVIHAHRARARELVGAQQGRVIDMSGDGVFAAFHRPSQAFRFSRALVGDPGHAKVQVRAGVHHGLVHANTDGLFGKTVHFAARVMECASASETWASDAARRALAEESPEELASLDWSPCEGRELEGIPGTHRLWQVS